MASLIGENVHGSVHFVLTPYFEVDTDKDVEDYAITILQGSGIEPIHGIFSVSGWQSGHLDLFVVARMMERIAAFADTMLPVDIWDTGKPLRAKAHLSVDWLHLVTWAYRERERVNVTAFVRDNSGPGLFHHVSFQARLGDAQEFGHNLEAEIRAACPGWCDTFLSRHP